MKKLLGIVFLALLLSGNAHSAVVELKKCSKGDYKFNPKHYEKRSWIINPEKSLVQLVSVLTDRYYEEQTKKFIEEFGDAEGFDKISVMNFKIEYSDKSYAKAIKKWTSAKGTPIETSVEIDIKKKKVLYKMHQKARTTINQCK